MSNIADPDLFMRALEIVVRDGKASRFHLNKQLKTTYSRVCAASDWLEHQGFVSPPGKNRRRKVLANPDTLQECRQHFEAQSALGKDDEPPTDLVTLPSYEKGPEYKETMRIDTDIESEIIQRICDGESLRQICKDAHMPNRSNWLRRVASNSELKTRWELAKGAMIHQIARDMLSRAEGHGDTPRQVEMPNGELVLVDDPKPVERDKLVVSTMQWILSRCAPEQWGESLRLIEGGEAIGGGNPAWVEPVKDQLKSLSRPTRQKLRAFLEQVRADEAA